ncbi:hypothetical protein KRR26_28985 [Corallococcus sp. M34]|uniref:hypothetical protein n=1 Tax=Citreicoccus inhibens TaxID=2849499 RepID=UPI001C220D2D|nr:hypothetical protein [Citreicoccus inhibens]MBU8899653.1 hypothetical protein [Citreicoccus inhibens]
MKFQCEACERLVPLEVFRVEAGALVVACGRCGAESRAALTVAAAQPEAVAAVATPTPAEPSVRPSVPALRVVRTEDATAVATGGAPVRDDFSAPPGFCPKCVSPRREDRESCAACGLVYANFLAEEHRPSEVLAQGWRALRERWADWDAHEQWLAQALARGELAMAGRLYRLQLAQAPEDAQARRGREEVVRRAATASSAEMTHAEVPLAARRAKAVMMGITLVVALVLTMMAIHFAAGAFLGGP